jgi:hypothetical protein
MELVVMYVGGMAVVILGGAAVMFWNARRMTIALGKHRS